MRSLRSEVITVITTQRDLTTSSDPDETLVSLTDADGVMGDTGVDPMESARYMAEISNRMQVPDRIMVSGDEQGGAATAPSPSRAAGEGKYNDLGMRQRDPRIDMQVRVRRRR